MGDILTADSMDYPVINNDPLNSPYTFSDKYSHPTIQQYVNIDDHNSLNNNPLECISVHVTPGDYHR